MATIPWFSRSSRVKAVIAMGVCWISSERLRAVTTISSSPPESDCEFASAVLLSAGCESAGREKTAPGRKAATAATVLSHKWGSTDSHFRTRVLVKNKNIAPPSNAPNPRWHYRGKPGCYQQKLMIRQFSEFY